MALVHIVLLEFKPTCGAAVVGDVCERLLALKDLCIHPDTKKPYVQNVVGGRDNSPEGHQGGFSHGFVIYFKNEEDRKYYLEQDPANLAFRKSLEGVIQNIRVVDFSPGIF